METRDRIADAYYSKASGIGHKNRCIIRSVVGLADRHGLVVASFREMQKEVGEKSLATVHLVVSRLIEAGCIEKLGRGVYKLLPPGNGNKQ